MVPSGLEFLLLMNKMEFLALMRISMRSSNFGLLPAFTYKPIPLMAVKFVILL